MTAPVVELFIGGIWVDVTALGHVYTRDFITITRGRSDGASGADPSRLTVTLNNRDGRYSPRNPLSPHYGQFGRNTPIRVTEAGVRRFHGELSSLPTRWDTTGNDAWVSVEAAGVLRRIGQGNQPVSNSLRGFLESTTPITYWPLTEGAGSIKGAPTAGTYRLSDFESTSPAGTVFTFGAGVLGAFTSNVLRINDLHEFDSFFGFAFGSSALPDALVYDFVFRADPTQSGDGSNLGAWDTLLNVEGTTSNTADEWKLQFRGGVNDDFRVVLTIDRDGLSPTVVTVASSAALAAATDGLLHHVRMSLVVNGSSVDATVYVDGVSVASGTRTFHTLRALSHVQVHYDRLTNAEDMLAFGHPVVWENLVNVPLVATVNSLAHGGEGEAAGRRIERLAAEAGAPFVTGGWDLDNTMSMGLQFEDQLSGQLSECEATDRGFLYEPADAIAIAYRPRTSLYNQAAAVTLSFAAGHLAPPLEPVDDDQTTRNDVFAQRREGGSYRATKLSGPLSVLNPPNGVGRYKDEQQVNVQTDGKLPEVAGWLLHLGTVDEARYPRVVVNLAATPGLAAALLAVDIGDRIVLTDLDAVNIRDDVSLIVLGYSETIDTVHHLIEFNCVPASPYDVAELDLAESRIDPGDASTLNAALTATTTSMGVASTVGTLWTTDAGQMPIPIMVGGEEMSVTAISGVVSPQTFTVVRSMNGVSKAHSSGALVHLKRPGVIAL